MSCRTCTFFYHISSINIIKYSLNNIIITISYLIHLLLPITRLSSLFLYSFLVYYFFAGMVLRYPLRFLHFHQNLLTILLIHSFFFFYLTFSFCLLYLSFILIFSSILLQVLSFWVAFFDIFSSSFLFHRHYIFIN